MLIDRLVHKRAVEIAVRKGIAIEDGVDAVYRSLEKGVLRLVRHNGVLLIPGKTGTTGVIKLNAFCWHHPLVAADRWGMISRRGSILPRMRPFGPGRINPLSGAGRLKSPDQAGRRHPPADEGPAGQDAGGPCL